MRANCQIWSPYSFNRFGVIAFNAAARASTHTQTHTQTHIELKQYLRHSLRSPGGDNDVCCSHIDRAIVRYANVPTSSLLQLISEVYIGSVNIMVVRLFFRNRSSMGCELVTS